MFNNASCDLLPNCSDEMKFLNESDDRHVMQLICPVDRHHERPLD